MIINTKNEIRLKLPAGDCKVSPALSRILGPLKVNPGQFCTKFNEQTKDKDGIKKGDIVVAGLIAKADKTFAINIYGIDISRALLKAANTNKGSQTPGKTSDLSVQKAQISKIAADKLIYVNHVFNSESMEKSIIATAKSCGIKVI